MSRIRADKFVDRAATGAPELTQGVNFGASGVGGTITAAGQAEFAGVCTASSFSGNVTGTATGLSGTPNITVGNITASSGDLTVRNVTGVAATFTGVLTYEDVTSVDSVGIVTARAGINVVGGGVTVTGLGTFFNGVSVLGAGITATGIGTFHEGVHLENLLAEEVKVTAGKLSDNTNINIEDGMVHLFTTAESTTSTPNIRYNGSTALNAKMRIGQSIVVTLITTANASAYSAQMTIDGGAQTERWIGGSAPDAGGSAGVDIHSFTIIKTADATFTVIGNHSKTS
jgi:hypothetical protein|tara:strand:+ start:463 stop:1320 length:858 start_codon:yes stop_codon:yes gene_type:complete